MSALTLTGCFQAPQANQNQPETKTEVKEETVIPPVETVEDGEGGGGVAADESAANYPSTYENEYYGFNLIVPASWGAVTVSPTMGDQLIIGSKNDISKEINIALIYPASKSQLAGDDVEEVWLGENTKWAFYYEKNMTFTPEAQELLKTFKAIEPTVYTTLKDKIENIDTIGFDFEGVLVSNCSKEAEALNAKLDGSIKTVSLTAEGKSFLNISKSANPDKLTKEQLETIITPCAELGANQVLKVTDEYILWGYPSCSAGAIPEEKFQPDLYKDYQNCLKVEKELNDYLGL